MTETKKDENHMTQAENEERDIEILKRAVAFSQANFAELRPGDRMNLKDDVWMLTGEGDTFDESRENFMKRLTDELLAKIHADFKTCFTGLVDGERSVTWKAETEKAIFVGAFAESRSDKFTYALYSTDIRETANLALIAKLVTLGTTPEQFRRCPECGTLFFLNRKPDERRNFYCSPKCATRVAGRNSRKRKMKRKKKSAA